MARKTFHHLAVGTIVPVQHVVWDGKSENLTVVATFQGRVVENKATSTRLRVDVLDCQRFDAEGATHRTVQSNPGTRVEAAISKQTGMEWGSEVEWGCWQIDPTLAQSRK